MGASFEEIDRRQTAIGEISVRRRTEPTLKIDVYEVKLGDEFLMSSLFTVAEVELAGSRWRSCRAGISTSSSAGSASATRLGRSWRIPGCGRCTSWSCWVR